MTKVNIIGAGGHCRSIIPLIEENSIVISSIFDNEYKPTEKESILEYPVVGVIEEAFKMGNKVILAIGDSKLRRNIFKKNTSSILSNNVIAKEALIRKTISIGISNQIFPFVFINSEVTIGDNNIINSKALIEHNCSIGSHCHISVGAILSGKVTIGDNCFIGAGAVIKDEVSICDDVIVGAGAVVVKNIKNPGTYIGNPLTKIK